MPIYPLISGKSSKGNAPEHTMRSMGAIASGRKQPRRHVAHPIVAAENDRKHANPLFDLIHVEPIDDAVDGQMAQARQQIVTALDAKRRYCQPIGVPPDFANAVLAMVQRLLCAFPEAEVAFEKIVEDQREISLGFRREFNSEPHGCGASLRSCAQWICPSGRR